MIRKTQVAKRKSQEKLNKKVFVGLSGGVDSAVSAALLKKLGYDVTGVFIKAWTPDWMPCTWKEDRRSAMRAAAVLDIPFFTLDLEKEYKSEVVDYMIAEYKLGRTPNPDVMCNKEIKFGAFLKWAKEKGADFIATGHYARTSPPSPLSFQRRGGKRDKNLSGGEVSLLEGKYKNKDQSYFLWTLKSEQLKQILFPVGNLEKSEVRKLAARFGLPQAARKDSQGLCFLGQVDMKEFLSHYIESKKGDVLNERGEVIGYHNGALFFTIGERHGFTITSKSPEDKKLYVVNKNMEKNTITVSSKTKEVPSARFAGFSKQKKGKNIASETSFVLLSDVNCINEIPKGEIECRFRYRQERIECKFDKNKLVFKKSKEPISRGQSVVFYDGEICLGGAIIN